MEKITRKEFRKLSLVKQVAYRLEHGMNFLVDTAITAVSVMGSVVGSGVSGAWAAVPDQAKKTTLEYTFNPLEKVEEMYAGVKLVGNASKLAYQQVHQTKITEYTIANESLRQQIDHNADVKDAILDNVYDMFDDSIATDEEVQAIAKRAIASAMAKMNL